VPLNAYTSKLKAAHCEYAAVAGDRIKDVPGARACDTEYDVATAGVDESGRDCPVSPALRAVIGQSHSVHPKRIRPRERDRASASVKDVKR